MTREEAKQWIENLILTMKEETSGLFPDVPYKDEVYEALDEAVKALSQDSCEDAISRQAAIEVAKQYWYKPDIAGALEELPSVQQEPRVDFKELKRKILMEVDGGTDDAWLAYGEVCNRISNSIDEFVADMRGEEE